MAVNKSAASAASAAGLSSRLVCMHGFGPQGPYFNFFSEYLADIGKRRWEGIKIHVSLATLAESVIFPDISKVQTLICVISDVN